MEVGVMTFAKCPVCLNDITVDKEQKMGGCPACGAMISYEEAINLRNSEIMFQNVNERVYAERKSQRGVATIICIIILILSYFFINPEVYNRVGDTTTSLIITLVIALFLCGFVVKMFSTKK